MARVLVTGGSGLLGSHLLVPLSKAGHQVRALYHQHPPDPSLQLPGIEWVKADICQWNELEAAFAGVDYVYHTAALVSYQAADRNRLEQVNIDGTTQIVNLCLAHGVKALCYVSSIAALGTHNRPEGIRETDDWIAEDKGSYYGFSKWAAECEVWRGIAEGLSAVIVNPGIILGETKRRNGSSGLFHLVAGGFRYYTLGTTAWVDVQDVVRAMMLLMDRKMFAERYILSSGNYSYKEVLQGMARALGVQAPDRLATPLLRGVIWRLEALLAWIRRKPVVLTRETAEAAGNILRYDNSKLRKALPDFYYTPLPETLERIGCYLQQQGLMK